MLRSKTAPQREGSHVPSALLHTPRVLLAEDDSEMRSMLAHWLLLDGYAVTECTTGFELLDRLIHMTDEELAGIDVIITDLRMPGLEGLEALEAIRFLELPPVLLMTAYGSHQVRARARALGVRAILAKPFDRDDLTLTLERLFRGQAE